MDAVIGIDPGKSGGIAYLSIGQELAYKMPETERDIYDLIIKLSKLEPNPKRIYIEKVHAMPGQGVTSMFSFGQNYGFLRACLIASEVPFEEIRPAQWQNLLGCKTKGNKNVTKSKAQQLFPDIKITHAIADALLIAEYGRRQ